MTICEGTKVHLQFNKSPILAWSYELWPHVESHQLSSMTKNQLNLQIQISLRSVCTLEKSSSKTGGERYIYVCTHTRWNINLLEQPQKTVSTSLVYCCEFWLSCNSSVNDGACWKTLWTCSFLPRGCKIITLLLRDNRNFLSLSFFSVR